jgi:hypothetical protein
LPDLHDTREIFVRDIAYSDMENHIRDKQVTDRAIDGLLLKRELAVKIRRSVRTVDLWMRQGKLPYLKVGKTVLFRWPDVLEKLNAYRVN